jgi:hypothetical protein
LVNPNSCSVEQNTLLVRTTGIATSHNKSANKRDNNNNNNNNININNNNNNDRQSKAVYSLLPKHYSVSRHGKQQVMSA